MRRSEFVEPPATAHDIASVVWVSDEVGDIGALVIQTTENEYVRWEPVSEAVFEELVDETSSFDGTLKRIARATTTVARTSDSATVRRNPEATQVYLREETAEAVRETIDDLSVSRWHVHDAVVRTGIDQFDDVVTQLEEEPPDGNMAAYVTVPLLMRRETRKELEATLADQQTANETVRTATRAAITEALVTTAFGHIDELNERLDEY